MSQMDSQRQMLYSRVYSIESDLSFASAYISKARNNIAFVESSMGSLRSRLNQVRGKGFLAHGYLENEINQFSIRWADLSPTVKQTLQCNLEPLVSQISSLQSEAQGLRSHIDRGNISYGATAVNRLAPSASTLRDRITQEAGRIDTPLNDLIETANIIDGNLKVAENTMALFSQASFPMKQGESPVLAFEGKYLKRDKCEGTLYFTNHRFVFEGKREVVLEKKFFIATKKKIERTVMINQPIGAVQEITKGRVGIIAWTGIYVRFKPGCGQEEAQFDVEDWEADEATKNFDYIIDGVVDTDIAAFKGITATPEEKVMQLVSCTRCHAPYKHEIYKGQKSVQCDYCGAQILVD